MDRSKCRGYAICAEICPDVYQIDDDGFVVLGQPLVSAGLGDSATRRERAPSRALN